jgi:N-acetylmuramic acid 6-phosphate etherase
MSRVSEGLNPRSRGIDAKTTAEVLEIINGEDSLVAGAVASRLAEVGRAVDLMVSTLRGGGRVFLVGAGTSGRLCVIEAAEIPPTYGLPPGKLQAVIAGGREAVFRSVEAAEDDAEEAVRVLARLGLCEADLVVGVSASGSTPFVLGAVKHARSLGAHVVGVTNNMDTPLSKLVDVAIEVVVGPEVVAGSTRMKAGTAQKMVLNMLTTAAMVRLGLVHDGYMVGVQASNRKLVERSLGMLTVITGVDRSEAESLLAAAGGDVRVAILLAMTEMTPDEARASLAGWVPLREILERRGAET